MHTVDELIEHLEPRRLFSVAASTALFLPATSIPFVKVGKPHNAIAGDFTNDGKTDIAIIQGEYDTRLGGTNVTLAFSGSLRVLAGDGTGHFKTLSKTFTVPDKPSSMIAGDFNKDGKLDLAMTLNGTTLGIMLGNGDGTFGALKTYVTSYTNAGSITLGDFNNDGAIDIAVAGRSLLSGGGTESQISVHFGLGNGAFTGAFLTHIAGAYDLSLASGDFDGDKRTDLAVASLGQLKILTSKGDGTFNFPSAFASTNPTHVIVSDLNGDGLGDLVWQSDSRSKVNYSIASSSGFTKVVTLNSASRMLVGDINGDTLPDIVTPRADGTGYYLGQAKGGFASVTDNGNIAPDLLADFNGDGQADLISADFSQISLAAPPPPVVLDANGTLHITGTRRSDTIVVTNTGTRIQTTINGVFYVSKISKVKKIDISTGLGPDRITIDSNVFANSLISAGGGNDTVTGGSGRDTIQGDNDDDVLIGGAGRDFIQGGKGNDDLTGGDGTDTLFGNKGSDIFHTSDDANERQDFSASDILQ